MIKIRTCFTITILFFMAAAFSCCENKKDETKSEKPSTASPMKETEKEKAETATAETHISQHPDIIPEETNKEVFPNKEPLHPVYMGMWGNCGGTGFLFDMDGTKGSYIPYDMAEAKEYGERRQLELVSYDLSNGMCSINAFLKGKYIGQFQGVFEEEEVEVDENATHYIQSYNGIFTSVNGAKLDFHFHFD